MPKLPHKHPRPIARMEPFPLLKVVEAQFGKGAPEGRYLPIALSTAIPLWMLRFKEYTPEQRAEELKKLDEGEPGFCCRMEWVLHRGPKPGDTARAFNDLARAIALLSFAPGGVTAFGQHYDWQKIRVPVKYPEG